MMHANRAVMLKTAAQEGVQPPEAFALTLLRTHDGVTQRELADILHLSPPRVSTIVQSLETSGAIVRRADEADRRLTRVFLTPEGHKRERDQRAILSDYVNRTIGSLSEADRHELERLLTELADRTLELLREAPRTAGEPHGDDAPAL
jgi:DNA-binding MarR family transcriptional regulator